MAAAATVGMFSHVTATACRQVVINGCRWADPPSAALLSKIAERTEGFAGADLQALCTSAVMAAAKRAAPSLIDQLCSEQVLVQHGHSRTQNAAFADQSEGCQQTNEQQQQQVSDVQQQQQSSGGQQQQTDGELQQDGNQYQQQQSDDHQQQEKGDHQHLQQQQPIGSSQQDLLQQQQQQLDQEQQQQQQQQQLRQQQQHSSAHTMDTPLAGLTVKACDWKAALAAAPLACSARQGQAALSSGQAKAVPSHLAPLLLPSLTQLLRCIAAAQLPVVGGLAAAVGALNRNGVTLRSGLQESAGGDEDLEGGTELERVLMDACAVERRCSGGELKVCTVEREYLHRFDVDRVKDLL